MLQLAENQAGWRGASIVKRAGAGRPKTSKQRSSATGRMRPPIAEVNDSARLRHDTSTRTCEMVTRRRAEPLSLALEAGETETTARS